MSGNKSKTPEVAGELSRREFLGSAAATAGVVLINPKLVRGTEANSAVRVGLLGCGGRGTEDATNLVDTGGARVVALADMFQDQLDTARAHFDKIQSAKGYAAISPKQLFVGPNAYQEIAASKEVDAIVVATPPYYHPEHFAAVVAGDKHVYLEKPVAVDVPGAKKVLEIGRKANGKISMDVGFQIRECPPFVEMVKRIHEGALGKIIYGEAHYWAGYIDRPAWPNASPNERRLRNWIHDRVLSGDIIVEQNIHAVDICNWILQGHPLKAVATGGRKERPSEGDNCYGHYNIIFYYPDDVTVSFSSAQFLKNGGFDVSERMFGTKGSSASPYSGPLGIWGDQPWQPEAAAKPGDAGSFSVTGKFSDNLEFADPSKKKLFVESITSGKFHNQTEKGVESALTCMMARNAAYAGHPLTWEELLKSTETWDAKLDLHKLG